MAKIYVTRRIPEAGLEMLKEKFGENEVEINPHNRVLERNELLEKVKGREAVLCLLTDKIDEEVMEAAGSDCKIFSNYAVGYNNIDLKAATEKDIMVTNTPGVLTDATADLAIALIIGVARRIVEADKYMRAGKYDGWAPMLFLGKEIEGKTLGIVGAGRIGSNIGRKMAKCFNMNILYSDRTQKEDFEKDTGAKQVDLETLCKESDFISLNLSYSPETHHMINEKMISVMKKDAIIVNTARGKIIDEEALVKALKENRIFGAGLDVFEDEPEMKEGLSELENVIVLPHIGSATHEARTKMSEIAAQNIIDALEEKKPEFLVNKEVVK